MQQDLAATLRQISEAGAAGFYKGPVARAIVASSSAGEGIITQADLDQYTTRELAPVECDYRGYHIVSAPPPSSGGVIVCEILNILEGYPLQGLGFRSAQAVHVPDRGDAPRLRRPQQLSRRSRLRQEPARPPAGQGLRREDPRRDRPAARPAISKDLKPGVAPHEGSNTTHYSIVDSKGNAVAVTYTLNDWFGAKVTAGGTGVLLNDEMDDFTAKLGVPNIYGLVQGEANAIAPGKRPLSSMTPTIVTKDGKPVMVLGTPGGSRIITVVLLTIINVIDYGMDIQEAVDAPRFHQQWLPESDQPRALRAQPGHAQDPGGHGAQVRGGRSRPTTSPRSWSARRRWAASRSATTASTARTIRAATPAWRSGTRRDRRRADRRPMTGGRRATSAR